MDSNQLPFGMTELGCGLALIIGVIYGSYKFVSWIFSGRVVEDFIGYLGAVIYQDASWDQYERGKKRLLKRLSNRWVNMWRK